MSHFFPATFWMEAIIVDDEDDEDRVPGKLAFEVSQSAAAGKPG